MGINILFIYPNTFGMNMIPQAMALFSSILRKEGHKVEIFDSTYYAVDYGLDSDGSQMEKLAVVPFSMEDRGIRIKDTSWAGERKGNLHRIAGTRWRVRSDGSKARHQHRGREGMIPHPQVRQ